MVRDDVKPSLYLETGVISYLVARPSRDIIVAGRQQLTREWWDQHRVEFALTASQLVLREAERGDAEAAAQRAAILAELELLALTDSARELARQLLAAGALPAKAPEDALHIASAASHGINVLLTWNFKHIANPFTWGAIWRVIDQAGYVPPTICTPEQLLEEVAR